jgi:hypothetical protein
MYWYMVLVLAFIKLVILKILLTITLNQSVESSLIIVLKSIACRKNQQQTLACT